jgi:carbonic anhydrase
MEWAPFGPASRDSEPEVTGSNLEHVLAANRRLAGKGPLAPVERAPARGLVVVTCMDARIDPLRALGLEHGDAHVLRNAGARVTEDVLRSLVLSHELMGTREALLIAHTDCAGYPTTDEAVAAVLHGAREILASSQLPDDYVVHPLLFDVRSGVVEPLGPA